MATRWGDEMSWQQETFWNNWDWQHEQFQRQEDMAAQQENWLREDTLQAQQYNSSEAEKAFNRQIQFQNMQNHWNSVQSQADRFRAAGINPYVALAGSGGQMSPAVSAPPAASSGIPSGRGSGLSSLSPIPTGSVGSHGSKFLDIVGAIKDVFGSLASASKAGVDTYQAVKGFNILDSEIRQYRAEAEKSEMSADLMRVYGDLEMKAGVDIKLKTADLISKQIITEVNKSVDYDASAKLKLMQRELAAVEKEYQGEQRDLVHQMNKTYMDEVEAKIANLRSSSRKNNADANKANEEADAQRFDNMQTWDAMQQGVNKYLDQHYNIHSDILLNRENRAQAHQFINKAIAESVGRQLDNQEQAMVNAATPELLANNIELVRSQWRKNDSDTTKNLYEMQREAVQMTIQGLVGLIIGLKGFGGNFHIKGFAQ